MAKKTDEQIEADKNAAADEKAEESRLKRLEDIKAKLTEALEGRRSEGTAIIRAIVSSCTDAAGVVSVGKDGTITVQTVDGQIEIK